MKIARDIIILKQCSVLTEHVTTFSDIAAIMYDFAEFYCRIKCMDSGHTQTQTRTHAHGHTTTTTVHQYPYIAEYQDAFIYIYKFTDTCI